MPALQHHHEAPAVFPAMLETYLRSYFEELRAALQEISAGAVADVGRVFERARLERRQIFIVGNGGSAATASHMACDLGKGTVDHRHPDFVRFRAISLTDNNALLTALGNDLSFEDVFAEQLKALMNDGDVVVFISASGNSPNLVRAAEYARSRNGELVGLLGFDGGALRAMVDHALVVSSRNYGLSEDSHLIVQHVLSQYLRRLLSGPVRRAAFVDRDGIINVRPAPHQYVTSWDQFRWTDGVLPMLRGLADLGFVLFVVSNQQGVGKGVLSEGALESIHRQMTRSLQLEGIELAGVLHCPHLEQAQCFCRKPRPGLIHRAMNEAPFLIDIESSVIIGDAESDMLAGLTAGIPTRILVGAEAGASFTHRVSNARDVLDVISPWVATTRPPSASLAPVR